MKYAFYIEEKVLRRRGECTWRKQTTMMSEMNRRLDRTGTGSQSKVTASVQRGTVTLTGILQYENQRAPIVKAISSIAGIRQVIDKLQSPPKRTPYGT